MERSGQLAERAAAEYLRQQGYEIIERNWRTRFCEIDIVARLNNQVLLVEVKYRRHSLRGTGFEYITPAKLARMTRAAEAWVQSHGWRGDYRLATIALMGERFDVVGFIQL